MVLYQGPPTVDRTSIESTDNENMAADDRIIKHSWCSEIIPFARYPSQNIPILQQWSPGSAYTDQNELPISRPINQEDHSRHIAAIKNESDDSISLSCSNFKQEGNFDQSTALPGNNLSILQASKTAISSELPFARDMSAHKSLLNWRIPLHSSRNKRKDLSDEEDVYDEQLTCCPSRNSWDEFARPYHVHHYEFHPSNPSSSQTYQIGAPNKRRAMVAANQHTGICSEVSGIGRGFSNRQLSHALTGKLPRTPDKESNFLKFVMASNISHSLPTHGVTEKVAKLTASSKKLMFARMLSASPKTSEAKRNLLDIEALKMAVVGRKIVLVGDGWLIKRR
ncbi:uncharacterized protein RSE6_00635 [Rhynchosporium secalis]|uniref:Uncharacterized protein n=1 Tax=Rhynchosporium secalis TaxID=38038 RepID=A0A1E1LVR0_RHYSE|nr:uncharacterized protein RSE6_00635 [Rhynchosporium secalis]